MVFSCKTVYVPSDNKMIKQYYLEVSEMQFKCIVKRAKVKKFPIHLIKTKYGDLMGAELGGEEIAMISGHKQYMITLDNYQGQADMLIRKGFLKKKYIKRLETQ
jgi:hypothetical protein